jgi:hypothetical protein
MYRPISDDEVRERCILAINDGKSKESVFMQLKADGRRISRGRLSKIWDEYNGPIQKGHK